MRSATVPIFPFSGAAILSDLAVRSTRVLSCSARIARHRRERSHVTVGRLGDCLVHFVYRSATNQTSPLRSPPPTVAVTSRTSLRSFSVIALLPLCLRFGGHHRVGTEPTRGTVTEITLSTRRGKRARGAEGKSLNPAAIRRVICPTADFPKSCPAPAEKIFRLRCRANQWPSVAPSRAASGGAYRDRHDTWRGMRWTRRLRNQTKCADADGQVVWSWPPDAGVNPQGS
jgi:hypothetical protein